MVLFFSESLVSVDLRVKKRFQKKLAKFKEREEKKVCLLESLRQKTPGHFKNKTKKQKQKPQNN